MKGYSGNTTFEYEVDRYLNKETLELVIEPSSKDNFEEEYQLVTLTVSGNAYFTPGNYTGAYEDCYPDEGDAEITFIIGPNNENWRDKITDSEHDSMIDTIINNVSHDDSWCDSDY